MAVPGSPRFMQATAASTASSRSRPATANSHAAGAPSAVDISEPSGYNASVPDLDVSGLEAAGGGANDVMKSQIDYGLVDGPRRSLRREIPVTKRQTPATTEGIASPTRGATLESPRGAADMRLLESGMFMAGGVPDPWHGGGATSREQTSGPYYSTHDKSLPNARRTQRGTGSCTPRAQAQSVVSHIADPGAPPEFLTDCGFSSAAMHRRGRGGASPLVLQPNSNPNEAGVANDRGIASVTGHGLASGTSKIDGLLGGRRARGQFSERPQQNLLAWGD